MKMSVEKLQEIGRACRERHHTDPVPKEFADMSIADLEYWIDRAGQIMESLRYTAQRTKSKQELMSLKRTELDFYIAREWLRTAELRLKREIATAQDGGGE